MKAIPPLRILLVDDHTLFRKGLRSLLEDYSDLEVVGEANDGYAAVDQVKALRPDVVLMDIEMPRLNGLEALEKILEIRPDTQIIMLTISDDDHDLFTAIKKGAKGYLLKNLEPDELYTLLTGLRYGYAAIPRNLASRILDEFSKMGQKEIQRDDSAELTPREMDVLKLIAQGMTNQKIAENLNISLNTVKAHLSSSLSKLQLKNRTQAAVYASKNLSDHQIAGVDENL